MNSVQSQFTTHVYEYLRQLYRNVDQPNGPELIMALPQDIQNAIYGQVYELAGRPQTEDWWWAGHHAFDDLDRLQRAIQQVVYDSFRNMPIERRNPVAERIWINGGRPDGDANWGENHANDNVFILFRSLIEGTRRENSDRTGVYASLLNLERSERHRNPMDPSTYPEPVHYISDPEIRRQMGRIILGMGDGHQSSNTTTMQTSTTQPTVRSNTGHFSVDDYVRDDDFETVLRMISQLEARTSSSNTSTINNSSNIQVVEETPMTLRKRASIERLQHIARMGGNAVNRFEFINSVSAFDLDMILQPYARNIPVNRLADLGQWAEIGQVKLDNLDRIVNGYGAAYNNSHQYNEARAQISQLISYFEQKRRESGVNIQQLKIQCRVVIDKMIDANRNCVDQMNLQLQDMLLDIAVDAYVPTNGDRRLGKMQCRAGQEITSHKVNILREVIARQNQGERHMADLEREILRRAAGSLGLNGAAFITGAHYANIVDDVPRKTQNAINAYYEQDYRPLEFLKREIALSGQQRPGAGEVGPIGKLRNELIEWADEHFDLLNEDPDEPKVTDMNVPLSKNFVAGSFTDNFDYGGEWSDIGTLFILEAAGIIRQK